eukprot:TRINITY_DN27740_c0_g1_i3.p1 TRINITY_DN27740_c0_g1~~TRINITY_DN27740_c0_g1_i3.p1  ORF type:complete len:453 (+),score=88.04 TRINITY_DN27740_c0_g1_i3:51-1361(+)
MAGVRRGSDASCVERQRSSAQRINSVSASPPASPHKKLQRRRRPLRLSFAYTNASAETAGHIMTPVSPSRRRRAETPLSRQRRARHSFATCASHTTMRSQGSCGDVAASPSGKARKPPAPAVSPPSSSPSQQAPESADAPQAMRTEGSELSTPCLGPDIAGRDGSLRFAMRRSLSVASRSVARADSFAVPAFRSGLAMQTPRNSVVWGSPRRQTTPGWGGKLPITLVTKVLQYVYCVRDLRAVALTSRRWRTGLGPPNCPVGLRAENPWQPYQGCWWVPRCAMSIFVIHLQTEPLSATRASGYIVSRSLNERDEWLVDMAPRTVTLSIDPSRMVLTWWLPQKTVEGKRTGTEVHSGAFDAFLVIDISVSNRPLPGKPVQKQLYPSQQGGALRMQQNCHLRRPKSKLAWHDLGKAAEDARTTLLRMVPPPGLQQPSR